MIVNIINDHNTFPIEGMCACYRECATHGLRFVASFYDVFDLSRLSYLRNKRITIGNIEPFTKGLLRALWNIRSSLSMWYGNEVVGLHVDGNTLEKLRHRLNYVFNNFGALAVFCLIDQFPGTATPATLRVWNMIIV